MCGNWEADLEEQYPEIEYNVVPFEDCGPDDVSVPGGQSLAEARCGAAPDAICRTSGEWHCPEDDGDDDDSNQAQFMTRHMAALECRALNAVIRFDRESPNYLCGNYMDAVREQYPNGGYETVGLKNCKETDTRINADYKTAEDECTGRLAGLCRTTGEWLCDGKEEEEEESDTNYFMKQETAAKECAEDASMVHVFTSAPNWLCGGYEEWLDSQEYTYETVSLETCGDGDTTVHGSKKSAIKKCGGSPVGVCKHTGHWKCPGEEVEGQLPVMNMHDAAMECVWMGSVLYIPAQDGYLCSNWRDDLKKDYPGVKFVTIPLLPCTDKHYVLKTSSRPEALSKCHGRISGMCRATGGWICNDYSTRKNR